MGGAIGTGLSFVAGGLVIGAVGRHGDTHIPLLGMLHPWQLTLVLIAIPGFLMAFIVNILPNPPRITPGIIVITRRTESVLRAFYRENKRLLACHHIALGGSALVLLGAYSWVTPLFSRVYGWAPATIGVTTGILVTIATPVGLLGGGVIGDYLMRYGAHRRLVVFSIWVVSGAVCALIYPLVPSAAGLAVHGGLGCFVTLPHGIGIAALQHIAPNEIRGRVSALFYLAVTVVAVLGPTLIASISDIFFPFHTGIRYATAITVPSTLLVSAALYLWAIPPYRRLELQDPSSSRQLGQFGEAGAAPATVSGGIG
jgi:MFS family permease